MPARIPIFCAPYIRIVNRRGTGPPPEEPEPVRQLRLKKDDVTGMCVDKQSPLRYIKLLNRNELGKYLQHVACSNVQLRLV